MEDLISVIIPVYNVEKYLNKCIESVLSQTFPNIEIILVDDGSTDNSGVICDEYAKKNCRIKSFHKKNGGLSSARNYGINIASGDYLIFLDSDDYWIDNNILQKFIRKAKDYDLDVVRGELINVDSGCNVLYTAEISKESLLRVNKILDSYEMMRYIINGSFFVVLFFYKTCSLKDFRFDENRKFQEDIDFDIRYFSKGIRCGYIPIRFYAYRHREYSIITTPRLENLSDSFALADVYYEYAHKVNDNRLSQLYIYNGIMIYYWTLETVASDLYIKSYDEIEKTVSLKKIRVKVHSWIKETNKMKYPIYLYVSPFWGVRLFRFRWFLGKLFRKIHLYNLLRRWYIR